MDFWQILLKIERDAILRSNDKKVTRLFLFPAYFFQSKIRFYINNVIAKLM